MSNPTLGWMCCCQGPGFLVFMSRPAGMLGLHREGREDKIEAHPGIGGVQLTI